MRHFTYFPTLKYGDQDATDILVRAKVREVVLKNTAAIYSHIITENDRPDTLSQIYYGSSQYTWVIFYANDIFDPIFDWPLNDREFERFIVGKYGNIGNARSEAGESLVLTLGLGSGDYTPEQSVFQGTSLALSTSSGVVTEWNPLTKQLRLKNVKGNFHPKSGNVRNNDNTVSYTIRTSRSIVHHYEVTEGDFKGTIIDQATYLDPNSFIGGVKLPVTFYEWESRENEKKRNLKLLDKKNLAQIVNEMRTIFL